MLLCMQEMGRGKDLTISTAIFTAAWIRDRGWKTLLSTDWKMEETPSAFSWSGRNRLRRRTTDQTVLGSNPAVAAALSPWTRLFTPIVQGEAFTFASISYLAILVKYILAKKKKKKNKKEHSNTQQDVPSMLLALVWKELNFSFFCVCSQT